MLHTPVPPRPRLLVVDDDSSNRHLVRAALGNGYDVLEAECGAAALTALADDPLIDLVLLDVMMPGLSGFDVCRQIKRQREADFLPVILLTALDSRNDRISGLAAGADDFLSKPIDQRILRLRVGTLLRVRQQEARIRAQLAELGELQRLKDELFSLIVHDLRNPLAGIMGYLELLQAGLERSGDQRLLDYATTGVEAALELRRLVEGVLQVRRMEQAALPVEREPVAPAELLAQVCTALGGVSRSQGVRLTAASPQDDRAANLDPMLVRRALENLTANALKVSAQGAEVVVGARWVGERVQFEVADRGPGLTDAEKAAMFEKFATGDRKRGFGLGLHLVKLVVEAHTGELEILDREGGGLVFRFSLEG